jgi:GTP 3',8-cyclase
MFDQLGRKINYLRISVTDRCNLRCSYCMPKNGIKWLQHKDILSFEEITEVATIAARLGCNKIRLTGGEPLMRKDITKLVQMLAKINGINDFAMTTNGTLLAKFAHQLKTAGLHRVNISLDTLNAKKFQQLTCGGKIQDVMAGIIAAKKCGLYPIKINCVVDELHTPKDNQIMRNFALKNNLSIRFISLMNLKNGKFSTIQGSSGGDCKNCNRLRLLSNGTIRPCLFSDLGFNVRELGPETALRQAILHKPKMGMPCNHEWMYNIGG